MRNAWWLVLGMGLTIAGCGEKAAPDIGGPNNSMPDNAAPNNTTSTTSASNNATANNVVEPPGGALTYWRDLRPVMDAHCVTCHDGQGVAPYDFTDAETVVGLGELIRINVESGVMPPWYPNEDSCEPLQGSLRLSADGVAAFGKWVDDGKLVGEPGDYVAGEVISADIGVARLAGDDVISLAPPAAYDVPTSVQDDFRCFTIDPGFETTRFVSGYEVKVDNAEVLHHMVLFAVSGDNDATLAALEAQDAEPGFECFGTPGVSDITLVGAWAPGGGRVGFPQGTALALEPGTKFVMQMHYNIDNGVGADRSTVDVWVMPDGQTPLSEATPIFVGNLPFEVPAGVNGFDVPDEECEVIYSLGSGVTSRPARGIEEGTGVVGSNGCVVQEFYYDIAAPLRVWAAFPHMHLVGETIKVEIEAVDDQDGVLVPNDEKDLCLIDMPRWDFNWQRAYWLENPSRVPTQGVVRLTCRYDNSTGTSPVRLGEGSGDEMCLALLYLSL